MATTPHEGKSITRTQDEDQTLHLPSVLLQAISGIIHQCTYIHVLVRASSRHIFYIAAPLETCVVRFIPTFMARERDDH